MKKWVSILLIFLMISLSACSDSQENGTEGDSSTDSEQLTEISIMLDWYPNALHSFLYVAKEKGYFQEEGIDVQFQFPTNPTDPLTLTAAGKVTLGLYYQPDVIMARANENIPIKSIASIVRQPLNHIVFMEDSPIQSPKDLEGKTVGYPGVALNESLLQTMVMHDGGDSAKVKMVDVGFELSTSIVTKKVDAVIGAFINHEVPVLEDKGYHTRYFNPVDYGVPRYSEIVLVTSDSTWERERDAIEAFWRAAKRGYEDMKQNPDEALQIILDHQDEANFPLVPAIEQRSLSTLLPMMETEQEAFGSQSKESWQEVAAWLESAGLISGKYDVEEMFVTMTSAP